MSSSRNQRGSINLTALGSAAVLAVYSAGYLRTRAAARRFETGEFDRRPAPPTAMAIIAADSVGADTASRIVAESIVVNPPKPVEKQHRPAAVEPARAAAQDTAVVIDSAAPATAAPTSVDTTKAVADSVKTLKDGTYKGWGTSRHGDIEAAVEIRGGRIVNAYITQCLTRYSCDRIAVIIPQVVARQSAEVDFVSGATQSTNAFYYAILEALSKAK